MCVSTAVLLVLTFFVFSFCNVLQLENTQKGLLTETGDGSSGYEVCRNRCENISRSYPQLVVTVYSPSLSTPTPT